MNQKSDTVRQELHELIQVLENICAGLDRGYDMPPMPIDQTILRCIFALESLSVQERLRLHPDWVELMVMLQKVERKASYTLKQRKDNITVTRAAFNAAKAYIDSQYLEHQKQEKSS